VNIASIAGKQGKGAFLSDYVALVIEAYARRLRGRRCSSSMTPPQVLDALAHAVWTRHREEVTDLTGGEPPQRQVLSILLHATSTRSRATTADEIQRSNRPRPSLDTTRQAWLRGGLPTSPATNRSRLASPRMSALEARTHRTDSVWSSAQQVALGELVVVSKPNTSLLSFTAITVSDRGRSAPAGRDLSIVHLGQQ